MKKPRQEPGIHTSQIILPVYNIHCVLYVRFSYESVINELHPYYHDMLCWALYQDLRKKIKWLDTAITDYAHRLNGTSVYTHTEQYDLLFLLKSFDLDIRQGYQLGTVFGCARLDLFDDFDYDD